MFGRKLHETAFVNLIAKNNWRHIYHWITIIHEEISIWTTPATTLGLCVDLYCGFLVIFWADRLRRKGEGGTSEDRQTLRECWALLPALSGTQARRRGRDRVYDTYRRTAGIRLSSRVPAVSLPSESSCLFYVCVGDGATYRHSTRRYSNTPSLEDNKDQVQKEEISNQEKVIAASTARRSKLLPASAGWCYFYYLKTSYCRIKDTAWFRVRGDTCSQTSMHQSAAQCSEAYLEQSSPAPPPCTPTILREFSVDWAELWGEGKKKKRKHRDIISHTGRG